ncbi:MAG: DUF4956 domain-containing protein [Thermoanaerobaculia bacterium]
MTDLWKSFAVTWEGRGEVLGLGRFLLLLALSAVAAFLVAQLYVRFFGSRATGSDIHRSFPLLAIAVTAIFVCIQFSLPLSLGLLGALSIVRFRTPIKEPEEIGFLMVVIATSLAAATGLLAFLGAVIAIAVVTLFAQELARPFFRSARDSGLVIATFEESKYAERSEAFFAELGRASRRGAVESVTSQDGRVTVVWRFTGLAPAEAPALERRIAGLAAPQTLSVVYSGRSTA